MSSRMLLVDISKDFKLEDIEKDIIIENINLDESETPKVIEEFKRLIEELKKYGQIDKYDSNRLSALGNTFHDSKLNIVKKRIDFGGWEDIIVNINDLLEKKMIKDWYVYLLECKDKTYYCGITKNIQGRLNQHNAGMGAKYTRGRKPVKLIDHTNAMTKSEALKLERKVKQKPKHLKLKVLKGELKCQKEQKNYRNYI